MGGARRPCREAQAYRSRPISAVGLAQAREKAAEAIRQLEKGQDPTRKGHARLKAEIEAQTYTFKRAVDEYLAEAAPTLNTPRAKPAARAASGDLRASQRQAGRGDWNPRDCGHPEIARSRNGRSNPHRA